MNEHAKAEMQQIHDEVSALQGRHDTRLLALVLATRAAMMFASLAKAGIEKDREGILRGFTEIIMREPDTSPKVVYVAGDQTLMKQ